MWSVFYNNKKGVSAELLTEKIQVPDIFIAKSDESHQAESLYKVYQIHVSFSKNSKEHQFLHHRCGWAV